MKNPGAAAESRQLATLLQAALLREARLWRVPVFKDGQIQGTDISCSQHHDAILWLGEMSRLFHFCPETLALGVSVLHRLLSTVKAQQKYLRCIAFTSLLLAAKINEEDEALGSVRDLVMQSGCSFSTAEILRMERIILDKLDWDLYTATAVDFIHIFHALLVSAHPHLAFFSSSSSFSSWGCGRPQKTPPGCQAVLWTRQVQHCMACHQLWQFKGSTLALAIITLELEELTPDWFSVFTDLLRRAQVDSGDLIHCKETVDQYLHSLELTLPANAIYIFDGTHIQDQNQECCSGRCSAEQQQQLQRLRQAKRGQCSCKRDDDDDYFDGLGRLYNVEGEGRGDGEGEALEEGWSDQATTLQTNVSPCPPLHPAGH
ncbi:cyclin-I [Nelusetta ayraudi]|uniref:cyclin-I n=1 Tax=Nelusetta ayraudi TaxID=303726 RepID=UPI003F708137